MKKSKVAKPKAIAIVRRLKIIIKSIGGIVEDERGRFGKGERKVWLDVKRREVTVEPIGYWYNSLEQVEQEEFELKDAIEGYFKYGFMEPRLTFEERKESGRSVLYCVMSGAEIKVEFRPKWYELLNGVNRMVFTEYENAKIRKKDRMQDILKSLRKVTRHAEHHCRKLGYSV